MIIGLYDRWHINFEGYLWPIQILLLVGSTLGIFYHQWLIHFEGLLWLEYCSSPYYILHSWASTFYWALDLSIATYSLYITSKLIFIGCASGLDDEMRWGGYFMARPFLVWASGIFIRMIIH